MDRFIRFIVSIILIAIILAGFVFSSFNTAEVPLWLGVEFSPQPVGLWLIIAFVLGGVIGLVLGFGLFNRIKNQVQIRQLKTRLRKAEKELDSLRNLPLKDIK